MAARLVPWCRIIGIWDHVELMCGCMQSVKWCAWPMRDLDIETCICCNMGHLFSTSPSESYYGFHHTVYSYIIVRCCCTLTLVGLSLLVGAVSLACTHAPEVTYNLEWVYCLYHWCAVYSCKINAWNVAGRKEGGRCHIFMNNQRTTSPL